MNIQEKGKFTKQYKGSKVNWLVDGETAVEMRKRCVQVLPTTDNEEENSDAYKASIRCLMRLSLAQQG